MIITREVDYALRILRSLADGERHPMRVLCGQEAIPQKFAYKIILKLRDAGIVSSATGTHGGCSLACDLHSISLYDLFQVLQVDSSFNRCMQDDYDCEWVDAKGSSCVPCRNLAYMQEELTRMMSSHSVYDLLFGDIRPVSIQKSENET